MYKRPFTTEMNKSEQISTINTILFEKSNSGLTLEKWELIMTHPLGGMISNQQETPSNLHLFIVKVKLFSAIQEPITRKTKTVVIIN